MRMVVVVVVVYDDCSLFSFLIHFFKKGSYTHIYIYHLTFFFNLDEQTSFFFDVFIYFNLLFYMKL